jgi:hypothetical protein
MIDGRRGLDGAGRARQIDARRGGLQWWLAAAAAERKRRDQGHCAVVKRSHDIAPLARLDGAQSPVRIAGLLTSISSDNR